MSLILHFTYENVDNQTCDAFEIYDSLKELEDHLGWLFKCRSCFEVVGVYKKDDTLTNHILNLVNIFSHKEFLAYQLKSRIDNKTHNEFLLKREQEFLKINQDLLNEKGTQHFNEKIADYELVIKRLDDEIEKLKKEMLNG